MMPLLSPQTPWPPTEERRSIEVWYGLLHGQIATGNRPAVLERLEGISIIGPRRKTVASGEAAYRRFVDDARAFPRFTILSMAPSKTISRLPGVDWLDVTVRYRKVDGPRELRFVDRWRKERGETWQLESRQESKPRL